MMNVRSVSILLFCFFSLTIFGQENEGFQLDDFGRIGFFTDIVETEDFSGSAKENLQRKLDRMVLKESLGSSFDDRFGLILKPVIYTKEKTSTVPPKYFYDIGIDIYAIDYQEKIQLSIFTFEGLQGINANQERAIIAALKDFNTSRRFSEFITEVKDKIVKYYNDRCDFILKEAQTLSSNDQYDEAILKLSSIPEVCKECFDKSRDQMTEVYKSKLNRECQTLVSEAKSLISQENYKEAASVLKGVLPGIDCHQEAVSLIEKIENHWCSVNLGKAKSFKSSRNFDEAAKFLSLVPTSSSCANEAEKLGTEIYSVLTDIDKRNWEFKMKKYEDEQEKERREFDFEVNKFERVQDRLDSDQKFNQENFDKIQKSNRDMQSILSREAVKVAKANSKQKINVKRQYSFLGF
jgi:hypothetical protein